MRTPGPSGGRKRSIRPRRGREAAGGILGVQPDLERVAAPRRAPGRAERLARGDPQLLPHEVDSGHELAHRVLDLQPRVELDEVEAAVGAEQELEGARVLVADRPACALRGGLHLLAHPLVERGRRRLLDQLLVPPLDRALALPEREHAAGRVAQHLHLDVTRRDERLLQVEIAVRERRLGLCGRHAVRRLELRGVVDEAHPLAAAARDRLQEHREAELLRGGSHLGERRRRSPFPARAERRRRAARPSHAPCRPSAPSRPRRARRRRARSPRTRARTPGSRPGSRSRDAPPRSASSRPRRRSTRCAGSCRRRPAGRCRRPGPRAARAASPGRRSSRRRPPRPRARAAARITRTAISPRFATRTRENIREPAARRSARARTAAGRTRPAARSRRESRSRGRARPPSAR